MFSEAASSGTLVATALEIAGYHYQAYLLDVLTDPFVSSIGSFLYIIAIASALVSYVVLGQYKLSGWLLIGPAAFLAVIMTRTEASIPKWKFAGIEQAATKLDSEGEKTEIDVLDSAVSSMSEQVRSPNVETANVAALFAGYNNLISGVVQEMVRIITIIRDDEKINAKFLLRAQAHGMVNTQVSPDQYFNDLVHAGFLSQCYDSLKRALDVNDPLNPEGLTLTERKSRMEDALGAMVTLSDPALMYLASLRLDMSNAGPNAWKGPEGGETMGQWVGRVRSSGGFINTNDSEGGRLRSYEERITQLQAEAGKIKAERGGEALFSCREVWKLVHSGMHIIADTVVDDAGKMAKNSGLEEDDLYRELLKIEGYDIDGSTTLTTEVHVLDKLREIVARNIFNNQLNAGDTLYPALLSRLSRQGESVDVVTSHSLRDMRGTYKHVRKGEEWRKKSEAFSYAQNLPYYQGVTLYFLAIMFPFFSLMLIIPGKHAAFLQWFVLWLWVKSWDVAFAIVMCLDDIFFDLMVSSKVAANGEPTTTFGAELDTAIRSLEAIDPSFGPTVYYTIIGTALASIPVITSQFIMSGLSGGVGLMASGRNIKAALDTQASNVGDGSSAVSGQTAVNNMRSQVAGAAMEMFQERLAQVQAGHMPPGFENITAEARSPELILNQGLDNLVAAANAAGFGEGLARALKQNDPVANGKSVRELFYGTVAGNAKAGDDLSRYMAAANPSSAGVDNVQKAASVLHPILSETRKRLLEARDVQLKAVMAWLELDSVNNPWAQEWSAIAADYGAMPIPWTNNAKGAYSAEFDEDIFKLESLFGIVNQSINAGHSMVTVPKVPTSPVGY